MDTKDLRDRAYLKNPVVNVVVLVHGHNEDEQRGFEAPTADPPWLVDYKGDVWTLFYDTVLSRDDCADRLGCTAFYEFIYLTYYPIVSPIQEDPAVKPLNAWFARLLSEGADIYVERLQFRFDPKWWRQKYAMAHGSWPAAWKDRTPGQGWKLHVTIRFTQAAGGDIRNRNERSGDCHYVYTFDPTGDTVTPVSVDDEPYMFAKFGAVDQGGQVAKAMTKLKLLSGYRGPDFSEGGLATPVPPEPGSAWAKPKKPGATRLTQLRYSPAVARARMQVAFELGVENGPAKPSCAWSFEGPSSPGASAWTENYQTKYTYTKPGTYTITVTIRDKRFYSRILDRQQWQIEVKPAEPK